MQAGGEVQAALAGPPWAFLYILLRSPQALVLSLGYARPFSVHGLLYQAGEQGRLGFRNLLWAFQGRKLPLSSLTLVENSLELSTL